MNLRRVGAYNIGLDIGTASVGWAVTDDQGKLCHFKDKPTWGSRLFPEAEKAADARMHRGQRRRYDRRRQRLDLLQALFSAEMEKVDPEFFARLNQSRLHPEDRDSGHDDYRWPLFNGADFNEIDYYKRFPTIYHLRKWLMESTEKADIRLIYLAFHNIVKHRGNFLQQEKKDLSAKNAGVEYAVEGFCEALQDWCESHDVVCCVLENADAIVSALQDTDAARTSLKERVIPLLGIAANEALDSKRAKTLAASIASALVGLSSEMANVFFVFEEEPEGLTTKIYLSNDEQVEAFEDGCPDDGQALFEAMKMVYSSFVLQEILSLLPGHYLSVNKVAEYERYAQDLAQLKELVREFAPEAYDDFFRGPRYERLYKGEKRDYDVSKAQGYTLYNAKRNRPYDDFKKDIQKLFKGTSAEGDSRYQRMMEAFEQQKFLRRLKTSDNGTIPYQLHLEEMNRIIEMQKQFYPFLEADREKLNSLVSFRIPYYVGPLTTKNARRENDNPAGKSRFAWAVRKEGKENEKIYPWNWEEIIDKNASAEEFITRMTGTCTYLQGEPVLPKNSLLYQEFCVLNELNGAHYTQDGDKQRRFDYRDRADIVDELFKNGGVSYKKLEGWMTRRGHAHVHVSGAQGEKGFESKLSSYIFFKKDVLGVDEIPKSDFPMIEEIIKWSTLFEDRDILEDKVRAKYGRRLDDEQIKKIKRKRFAGWGNLSREFLTGIKAATDDGPRSIMDVMREGDPTNGHGSKAMVLMEALRDDNLRFQKLVDEENEKRFGNVAEIAINELPGSPALRRGINQAMKIVKEIVGIVGHAPRSIFIEVTRSDDDKRKGSRTKRRYEGLKEQLKQFEDENPEFYEARLKDEFASIGHGDLNEKLTLYFMQGGKSLYSGKPLDIDRLSEYEVDHILPQSYVKDDSFENKALVLKEENQRKSDQMLLPADMRNKMRSYWRALHGAGLIGEKKLRSLERDSVSDKQLKGFINRQIVETSQIVKTTQMVLKSIFPETNVLPVKAGLSSELRRELGLVKCREVNDFHHAHDAYLACEIGRFVQLRFPDMYDNPLKYQGIIRSFIKGESEKVQQKRRVPYGSPFVISSFLRSGFDEETGEIFKDTWNAQAEIAKIKRTLGFWQCFITRMPEETSGALWNDTIYSPHGGKKTASIPLKKGLDVDKYGGYSGKNPAYFAFIEAADAKGRTIRLFEGVPIVDANRIASGATTIEDWAQDIAGSQGFSFMRVLRSRLLKYARVNHKGDEYYVPALDVVYCSRQLILQESDYALAKAICDFEEVSDSQLKHSSLLYMYRVLSDKATVLCSRYSVVREKLIQGEGAFQSLAIADKRRLLCNLFAFFKNSTSRVDLSLIGGSPHAGAIKSGFLSNCKEKIIIVDQSVTGMFESRESIGL